MPVAEPTLAALPNPVLRYALATRPAFLLVTLCAVLLGLASASLSGIVLSAGAAGVTALAALLVHAGVNVLNDYYDELNGTDRTNVSRLYPYTGGSRFIQNGVLTLRATGQFGAGLLAAAGLAGLWLAYTSGPGLIAVGMLGLAIGWGYSGPPLRLNSRGLGEPSVAAGFALIAIGTDYVQRGGFALAPLAASACYALLVTNLLYVNQFPDLRADELAGKRHWVVRLGPARARWGYALIALSAYLALALFVAGGTLPPVALLGLLAAPLSFVATLRVMRHAATPAKLAPAIRATLAAACVNGVLTAAGCVLGAGPTL